MAIHHPQWHMTTQVACTNGHPILVHWTLTDALVDVVHQSGVKVEVTADCCQIVCEGATLINKCLICLACGADVPSPTVEALLNVECPPTEEAAQADTKNG